jgi:YggT family protein
MITALLFLVLSVLRIVELLVLGAVIAQWLGADPNNFLVRILRETTEPLFRAVRPIARKIPGPLDWSPMIVLLLIELLRNLIASVW